MLERYNNKEKKQTIHQLSGLSEMLEYAPKGKDSCNSESRNDWYGGANWDDAYAMARTGWPEGHRRVQASLSGMVKTDRPLHEESLVRSPCGPMYDVADLIAGMPEPCYDFAIDESERSVVKIGAHIGAQCGYSKKAFANRGAVAVALVEALETARMPVEKPSIEVMNE